MDHAQFDTVIDRVVDDVGKRIVVGLPLGLGKPNRLINALYRRAVADPEIELEIVTALSLDIPEPAHWLEGRLMGPIVDRLFGADYPRLEYLVDLKRRALPDNVRVTEFYFQSGAALGNSSMQRHYVSSNYTHVARDLIDRGVNLMFQLVARDADGRLSLSCNPDVTLDLVRRAGNEPGYSLCSVAQVHPDLPFMHGDAVVEPGYFDHVVDVDPNQPVRVAAPAHLHSGLRGGPPCRPADRGRGDFADRHRFAKRRTGAFARAASSRQRQLSRGDRGVVLPGAAGYRRRGRLR